MSNTSTIIPSGIGMDTDSSKLNPAKGSYLFALNAILNDFKGDFPQVQNDSSNILAVNLLEGYITIGKAEIHELNKTVLFLVNSTTLDCEIGEINNCKYEDKTDSDLSIVCGEGECISYAEQMPLEQTIQTPYCTYKTLVNDKCLNFNIDYPISIEYRITNCGINFYFVDNYNDDRFIYFDFVSGYDSDLALQQSFYKILGYEDTDCKIPIYSTELDCNKIKFNPIISRPNIEFKDFVFGGRNRAGVYQAMVAYADESANPLTNYFSVTNPVSIFDKPLTFETNYISDKSPVFQINNLDLTGVYNYYNIVIIETVDDSTTFVLAGTFPVTKSEYIYTGRTEQMKSLTPNDVFYKNIYYNKSYSITQANNTLYRARPTERRKYNLQPVINGVKVYWQTKALKEGIYKSTNQYKTYQRDEVYALGLIAEFNNGDETSEFHIAGTDSSNYDSAIFSVVNNNDVIESEGCIAQQRNLYWQVYNTASVLSSPHQMSQNCDDNNVWESGRFAYWESTETYPNRPEVWGELCGKPIRHHKFPDCVISHTHDGLNTNSTYLNNNIIYPIGIKVDHQSVIDAFDKAVTTGLITQDERNSIISYRIVRANRDRSIIAKGFIYDMWSYDKFNNKYYYPNYAYNDLTPDKFISNDPKTYEDDNTSSPRPNIFQPSGRYTFHSPDTSFTEPGLSGTELKLETVEYGKSEGYFNECQEESKQKFLSTFATSLAFGIGIAAALSATGEKECTTYRIKSASTEASLPPSVTTWSNLPFLRYEKSTGLPIIPVVDPSSLGIGVESYEKTTCKGSVYQLLSPLSTSGISIVTGLLNQLFYRTILGLNEMQISINLMKALIPKKNMSIQYNSVGKYNSYIPVNNDGNKIRKLDVAQYLSSNIETIDESLSTNNYVTTFVNNYKRESSVYLKIGDNTLPPPVKQDNSRVTMNDAGLGYKDLNHRIYRDISSYYASLKRYLPNQYGNIFKLEYLEVGSRSINLNEDLSDGFTIFGGDTFLGRFALKRKMPFFLQSRLKTIDESDVEYSTLGNVGYPNYYFNTERPLIDRIAGNSFGGDLLSIYSDMIGVAESRLDARVDNLFYQKGYIHLYNYGIPYFIVESDVNLDLRHGENINEKDFYPHQKNLDYWLQEINVPIKEDNQYIYNRTYSKQNKEGFVSVDQPQTSFDSCVYTHDNRLISSQNLLLEKGNYADRGVKTDPYLIFKSADYKDFDFSSGKLFTVNGIESDKLLVRFENNFEIYNAYNVLNTDATKLQISNGNIFESRGQKFSVSSLGFAGTQHRAIIQTEFGHIWVDASRGSIINLGTNGGGIDELTKNGMSKWFKNNLPFQILKDFPTIALEDIDNNFKGIGIDIGFDKRNSRILITKQDYKCIDKNVTYNTILKKFQVSDGKISTIIDIKNKSYFIDKSWTISYNFFTQRWVSFHSFIPKFYLNYIDYFQTCLENSLWSHNLTNKSYQVYNGKLQPFIVELSTEPNLKNNILNSIQYVGDTVRYHNEEDYYIVDKTFNKAIVYSDRECTGQLELVPANPDNFYQSSLYPQPTLDSTKIEVYNTENIWRFNDIWNSVRKGLINIPIWLNDSANVNKRINPLAINYQLNDFDKNQLRGNNFKVRFTNDKYSNYNFKFYVNQFNQVQSYF